jgi:hypothetical protein
MLTRIVYCVVGVSLLVGPVTAQPPPREDATEAEVVRLRAQAQALLAQAQALLVQAQAQEAKQARADRQAAEKYLREFADSCLEALLKGNAADVVPLLNKEMRDRWGPPQDLDVVQGRGVAVSSYKITSSTIAPGGDEAIFRAEVHGKSTAPAEKGRDMKATVTLRVRKESGRYVLGFLSAVVEK